MKRFGRMLIAGENLRRGDPVVIGEDGRAYRLPREIDLIATEDIPKGTQAIPRDGRLSRSVTLLKDMEKDLKEK